MTLFFAQVEGRPAFFDSAIHGEAIPSEAVEITEARHAQLIEAQAIGKEIYADDDGTPRYRQREFPAEEIRANLTAQVKREAARRIDLVSPLWRQMNDLRAERADADALARFEAIDAIRAASDAIETVIADTPVADLETFTIADRAEWPALPSMDAA